jgi:hypothetical protein
MGGRPERSRRLDEVLTETCTPRSASSAQSASSRWTPWATVSRSDRKADGVEMGEQPAGIGGGGPFLLIGGFEEVHMHAAACPGGAFGDLLEDRVVHPLRADRAVLDVEEVMFESRDVLDHGELFGGCGTAAGAGADRLGLCLGQAVEQWPGVAVGQRVAARDRHGEGHAHAHIAGGAGDGLGLVHQARGVGGVVAVVERGDAGFGHAGEGDGSAQVGVGGGFPAQGGDPDLQRVVARAEGDAAHAAPVVMGVRQRGQDQGVGGRIALRDIGDDPVSNRQATRGRLPVTRGIAGEDVSA